MSINIKELNTRLGRVGLWCQLTPTNVDRLKALEPRQRIIHALERVETSNDTGARTFLARTLARLEQGDDRQPAPAKRPSVPPPQASTDFESNSSQARSVSRACRDQRPQPETLGHNRPSYHVYGRKAAVMFELDATAAGKPTVALDAARATGERRYDWSGKIRLQMTLTEVPEVAAVLLGLREGCVFTNHGPDNDKGFEIQWQSERNGYFIKVWQGQGNLRAVPMSVDDAFQASQILLRAIQQASPARLDATGTLALLRAFYGHQ